ncbi:MAG: ABC transporter ATP-binding protein [Gemmataceae bacterium]|nr:ABC transporter ATP-binding protein [Gemmataceae bacterium]MDW8264239.1 ABC transporter ATP-binding protein [Gemmataceae bacterium]
MNKVSGAPALVAEAAAAGRTTAGSGPPILVLEGVSKWYGPVIGLNQVTLALGPGITGLVGANGAGKTTLMRLATGQLRPDLGRVTVRGLDPWSAHAKCHIGYCPDGDTFYESMTGREFVETMARLCGFSRAEARRRAADVLQLVGMSEAAERRLRGFSKGMRQRIKLAQALVHDPDLLVLDEPLSGIDPIGRQEVIALFRELAHRGKCLLVSSHELEELEKLTDHVAIMARGRIAAVGTVPQIRDLLDDYPLSIRIVSDRRRELAAALLDCSQLVGLDLIENDTLLVKARWPREFLQRFGRLVVEEGFEVRHLEVLDDSAGAVLSYVLGAAKRAR